MILITTGSQKFQFNRLLEKVDELIEDGTIKEEVFAQIGSSDYVPKHYEYEHFLNREDFAKKMDKCDIVLTHGGTGIIMTAVKKGKKVIAVPRLAQYGEHVDDHQVQLLTEFGEMGIICSCMDMNNLKNELSSLNEQIRIPYVSNTQNIIMDIEEYLNGAFK